MGYRVRLFSESTLTSVDTYEGEPIEMKIERIVANKEPIKDGAPEIYTERKDGVISAYNIRTDRWEIATDAMDAVSKSIQARRDSRAKLTGTGVEEEAIKESGDSGSVGEAKSIQGGKESK